MARVALHIENCTKELHSGEQTVPASSGVVQHLIRKWLAPLPKVLLCPVRVDDEDWLRVNVMSVEVLRDPFL
jgi:hypothetical protein